MNDALLVIDIQRMSSEDGPGLRTTAFLKGCPLACEWCHNPESISFEPEVLFNYMRCIKCESCVKVCPERAIAFDESDNVSINRSNCVVCIECSEGCPTGALELKGKEYSPQDLLKELAKDKAYFGDDGGVTLSGGEALMQYASIELLRLLKEAGIQTAVDTCGLLKEGRLEEALEYTDVLLFDIKIADDALAKLHTGAGTDIILENLKKAGQWAEKGGRLWIRTPIIPSATDSPENISAIGSLLKEIPNIERWELCAFNNLCANKYRSLNLKWAYEGVGLVTETHMEELLDTAKASEACRDTRATGATSKEEKQ